MTFETVFRQLSVKDELQGLLIEEDWSTTNRTLGGTPSVVDNISSAPAEPAWASDDEKKIPKQNNDVKKKNDLFCLSLP